MLLKSKYKNYVTWITNLTKVSIVFSKKKNQKRFFDPEKRKSKKWVSKVAHNRPRPFYFTVQPRPTAHDPELIFHIMKSRDQTSVLLSVIENIIDKYVSSLMLALPTWRFLYWRVRLSFCYFRKTDDGTVELLFLKLESWNFQVQFKIKIWKTSQNFNSFT